jgi:hypothetical protein
VNIPTMYTEIIIRKMVEGGLHNHELINYLSVHYNLEYEDAVEEINIAEQIMVDDTIARPIEVNKAAQVYRMMDLRNRARSSADFNSEIKAENMIAEILGNYAAKQLNVKTSKEETSATTTLEAQKVLQELGVHLSNQISELADEIEEEESDKTQEKNHIKSK